MTVRRVRRQAWEVSESLPPFDAVRREARSAYGSGAAEYEQGRSDCPPIVWDLLRDRGLAAGAAVLEIGPGTGQATRHLVAAGADVTAIEPDPGMAGALRQRLPGVRILESTAEDATVPDGAFDLVVAATSLHWLDRDRGTGFQLDDAARHEDLRAAGLVDVEVHRHAWDLQLTPGGTRALFATLIGIIRLPETERTGVLDRIEAAAAAQPGGVDRRPLLTVLYSGRRP